ncbi:MAG: C25 family cysteine peptidase, partial [Chloroflexota bacterium]|nr:C25 family cysteine peptidase [Chloroflexota bacterium]
ARVAAAQTLSSLVHPLEPVPIYHPVQEPDSDNPVGDWMEAAYLPDPALYNANEWFPAEPVTVGEPAVVRGQALLEVRFTPVQVNLATGALRWFPSADVTLSWSADATPRTGPSLSEDPHFEPLFKGMLSNYEQSRMWRVRPQASRQAEQQAEQSERVASSATSWLIQLEGKGLFRIPLADLAAQGVDVSDPSRLAVYYGSGTSAQEQAIWLDGSALYLVNTRDHSRWSRKLVYRLEVLPAGNQGKRMNPLDGTPNQPGAPRTAVPYNLRLEEDHTYMTLDSSAKPGERWFWAKLTAYSSAEATFDLTFDLPHLLSSTSEPVTVTPEIGPLVGSEYASYCRDVRFSVNQVEVQQQWTGPAAFAQSITLSPGQLSSTGNRLHIEHAVCAGTSADAIMFNGFTVSYQRALDAGGTALFFDNVAAAANYQVANIASSGQVAFEVSDPSNIRHVTNASASGTALTFGRPGSADENYLVTSLNLAQRVDSITRYQEQGLHGQRSQADYLVITHPDFVSALQPLVQHRAAQGLTTRLVTTNAIYNDFGNGTMDPEAIRNYIEYAYTSWDGPPPAFVLLVGDGTYDPLDLLGTGTRVWLPPMLVYRDNYLGEVPSDNAYVSDLAGGPQDHMPDIHIGRFPVNSPDEAAAMVAKVIDYESDPPVGEWQRSFLLVADNPDSAGNFHQLSDKILPLFPERAQIGRAYLPNPGNDVLPIRDAIKHSMDRGRLIVQYVGHGSPDQWASSGGVWALQRYVSGQFVSDLELLRPSPRYPMSLTWACWDGYFIKPDRQAMSESMMRLSDRGTIAAFSPVGLDVASAHDLMTQGFYEALLGYVENDPITQLGPLTWESKRRVRDTYWERLIDTYILLGDPATHLNIDPCLFDGDQACSSGGHMFLPTMSR